MPRQFELKYDRPVQPIAIDPPEDCKRDMFDNQYIHSDDCTVYTNPDSSAQYTYNA